MSDGTATSQQSVQVRVFDVNRPSVLQVSNHALSVGQSFSLPEGASYDATARQLTWSPGPGQVGDYIVTARAWDGFNTPPGASVP